MKLSVMDNDDCCFLGSCKNNNSNTTARKEPSIKNRKSIYEFSRHVKTMYAAALGIEILCITAAEIGENTGLYVLGFNHIGVPIAYTIGYCLATFTTFVTILGRYRYGLGNGVIDGCCSILEQDASKGFLSNVMRTFKNFGFGIKKIRELPKQPNVREILNTSFIILITAETACIITAETIDLIFYKEAIYLSIPLALLAGAFTVVVPEVYRKMKEAKSKLN
jgi:hypothetical protein